MKPIVFKNISATDLIVNDLGIQIAPGEDIDLATNFDEDQVLQSNDLQSAVENQGQLMLDGVTLITYQELMDYLTALNRYDKIDYNYISSKDDATDVTGAELERLTNASDASDLHNHNTSYYSKTQLSTSGQASIDYSNLINIPNFYWKQPVANIGNLPATLNVAGDVRLVRSTNQFYTWSGTAWVNVSKAINIAIDPISGYSSTDVQSVLEAIKTEITNIENGVQHITKSLDDAYGDGSVINVDSTNLEINLSSGKNFSIDSSIDNSTLFSVSNSSIVISSKGPLTLKDSNMTSSISLSQTGQGGLTGFTATSIIGALNELKSGAGSSNVSLQGAYDNGRTININNKAIAFTYSSYAPLQFQNAASAPNLDLQDGQVAVIQGDLCAFDSGRMKWLSVAEMQYLWSDQACNGKYLRIGVSTDASIGYLIPKNCTIIKVAVKIASGNQAKEMQIRRNGTTIKTFNLSSGSYYSNSEDINVAAGSLLQAYCSGGGGAIQDPVMSIYIKWRNS